MKGRWLWIIVSLVVLLLEVVMVHPEYGAIEIPCPTCKGTGDCQTCGGDAVKKRTCVRCYYSGNCSKCGGTKVEVVTREQAARLGYR